MNSLITIASYSNSLQANIVKGRLQAEDIPATLANEQYINADWLLSNALGGVQIQVPTKYEQQAKELIDSIDSGQLEVSDDEAEYSEKDDKAYSTGTILFYIVILAVVFSVVIEGLFLLRSFL